MNESDLYPPVKAWLEARGYEVHVEMWDCDVIGVKGEHIVVVELKRRMTWELITQLRERIFWADEAWAAVPYPPIKSPDCRAFYNALRREGIGALTFPNGRAHEHRKARQQPYIRNRTRAHRLAILASREPAQSHEVAGLPACHQMREQRQRRRNPCL